MNSAMARVLRTLIAKVDVEQRYQAEELLAGINAIGGSVSVSQTGSRRLIGTPTLRDVILLIAGVGGGATLKQLASVLVAWIRRHENCKLKLGDTEITGYSVSEVQNLLRSVSRKKTV
jgi:hypothetical protein